MEPAGTWPMARGLAAVTLWELAPVATRAAVAHLAPVPLPVLQLIAAALVLLLCAMPVLRRPRSLGRLAAAGTLGLGGGNLPVHRGVQWLPAATAGLLLATGPVWVMILGKVFLAERAGARASASPARPQQTAAITASRRSGYRNRCQQLLRGDAHDDDDRAGQVHSRR